MAFLARYSGTCAKCQSPIIQGEHYINWSRRKESTVKGAYHADCENPTVGPASQANEPRTTQDAPHVPQGDLAAAIANAVASYLPKTQSASPIDRETVESMIEESLANMPSRTVTVEIRNTDTGASAKTEQGDHSSMAELLYYLSKRHHVYLYGEPGSGKSTAAKMAANRMGIQFGYISLNPQTTDSRLMGYMDANRNFHETVFYHCYRDGGVFCIDEMDNASPALLTTLNSCLENGHAAFPCGMIERHKDFVMVATGNTCGKGANPKFPERRPFDVATAERFTYIEWQYDLELERAITLAINPKAITWLNWVRSVRDYCATSHPKVMVTPRASFKGAEYLKDGLLSVNQIAGAVVFKGLDKATQDAILAHSPLSVVTVKH